MWLTDWLTDWLTILFHHIFLVSYRYFCSKNSGSSTWDSVSFRHFLFGYFCNMHVVLWSSLQSTSAILIDPITTISISAYTEWKKNVLQKSEMNFYSPQIKMGRFCQDENFEICHILDTRLQFSLYVHKNGKNSHLFIRRRAQSSRYITVSTSLLELHPCFFRTFRHTAPGLLPRLVCNYNDLVSNQTFIISPTCQWPCVWHQQVSS